MMKMAILTTGTVYPVTVEEARGTHRVTASLVEGSEVLQDVFVLLDGLHQVLYGLVVLGACCAHNKRPETDGVDPGLKLLLEGGKHYMHMHTCTHTHTHTHMHAHTQACTHTHMHACTHPPCSTPTNLSLE